MIRLFGLFALLFLISEAHAACTAPTNTSLGTGQAGEFKMSIGGTNVFNKLMYCDGTTWQDLGGSTTATACTKNGEVTLSGGELFYCNATVLWRFDSGAVTNGACTKSGEIRWNTTQLEFCNGTNWRVVSADANADPVADITETNQGIENARGIYMGPVTGFTGGTGTFTLNNAGGTCINMNVRVCSDTNGCATAIATRTSTGTLPVPNGSYIRFGTILSTQPTTTCTWTGVVGGRTFVYSGTTTATDTFPTFEVFVNVTNQPQSSVITSTIVRVYGHTGVTASVNDNGTGGTPEFRVCSDSTCSVVDVTWGTASQALTNPKWIQVRTNTPANALDLNQVNLVAGTNTSVWFVTTSTCPFTMPALAPGATQTCTCPASSVLMGGVFGSGNYKQAGTSTCKAAVHAGAITNAAGGSVTIRGTTAGTPSGTCPSFSASTANSVTSQVSTSGASSYFVGFGTDTCN